VRAIKDEPGFRLDFNPPLPPGNLYQQHRQQHDPPVHSRIRYWDGRWVSDGLPHDYASLSSFAKYMILERFDKTHQTNSTGRSLNRRGDGGRLDGLLTQSPHTLVAGCTSTLSRKGDIGDERALVLTNSSHTFVAWTIISSDFGDGSVSVAVETTEAPVCASGAFKDRFPLTTQLGSEALGRGPAVVFDGRVVVFDAQVQQFEPPEEEGDDGDDDGDGGDESDDVDDDGGGAQLIDMEGKKADTHSSPDTLTSIRIT